MANTIVIDCFPSSASRYQGYAIVAIDVIRATTMAVTAAANGWHCFVADGLNDATALKARMPHALLAGELAGRVPAGFEMNNSPAELSQRADLHRPVVLLSSSGTQLMVEAAKHGTAYVACARNYLATASYLLGQFDNIAVIGAGSRSEFREEDQLCCAWLADEVVKGGYHADERTIQIIERWRGAPFADCCQGNSVAYLRRSNQLEDLEFIVAHVNDLDSVFTVKGNRVIEVEAAKVAVTNLLSADENRPLLNTADRA